jgi:sigma-B regulation protein RsbU (phosphoserine phosphatase)
VKDDTPDRLATLYRISQAFSSSLDLDEVLNRVMDEVVAATHAERGFLMLRDVRNVLRFRVARGLDQRTIEAPEFQVSQGLVERVDREGKPTLASDAQTDEWLASRNSVQLLGLHAILCVPLQVRGVPIGVIYVDNRLQAGVFSPADLELLTGIATSAAISIENARLYQIAVEKGRLERELQLAREVQASLIPRVIPSLPGWEFAALWQPAREVSGDFYDFLSVSDGRLGVIIADVTDKGMPAALFMANARSLIRSTVIGPGSPSSSFQIVNRLLCADSSGGMFVTLCYLQLDLEGGSVQYVNAGHNPPLLYQAQADRLSHLDRTGIPLGIEPQQAFGQAQFSMGAGDFILLYTDGVTEATDGKLEEFGLDRLQRLALAHRHESAGDLVAALERELKEFIGAAQPSDDITVTVVRRL